MVVFRSLAGASAEREIEDVGRTHPIAGRLATQDKPSRALLHRATSLSRDDDQVSIEGDFGEERPPVPHLAELDDGVENRRCGPGDVSRERAKTAGCRKV